MANGQIVKSTIPLAAMLNVQTGPLKHTGRAFVSGLLAKLMYNDLIIKLSGMK